VQPANFEKCQTQQYEFNPNFKQTGSDHLSPQKISSITTHKLWNVSHNFTSFIGFLKS